MEFLRVEDNYFPRNTLLNAGGKLFTTERPLVMGILNITPDSFYAGSRFTLADNYLETAGKMLEAGATILDIGGYSSRPGAEDISPEEEKDRILPVVTAICNTFPDALISIDTFRASVARSAIEAGADIINDISGGTLDEQMFQTAGELGCPYILMHMKGTPQTMQSQTVYDSLFTDVYRYFTERIQLLKNAGVKDIILDPGFGFAKTTDQNYDLLGRLQDFQSLGHPILAGLSRKSMIYKKLGTTPEEALNGTTVLNTIALTKGASILRVHDVREAVEAIRLIEQTNN
jgi:dihydropteroate synthase